MDFAFSPELEAFRKEVADYLDKEGPKEWAEKKVTIFDSSTIATWIQDYRSMAEKLGAKGWLTLHWPVQFGGKGLSPFFQVVLVEELFRYHSPGYDPFGLGMVGPAIMLKGTEEQKNRHLPGIAQGKVMWCETLSEPGHGSDLGNAEVFAREEAEYFVVDGQKIWTSNGHFADWTALIARTDRDIKPRYKGLSMFLVDMKTPGITVRPIINMAGHHDFNEVFFDEVKIPKENLLGGKNQGFYVVLALLDYERTAVPVYPMISTYLNELAVFAREKGLLTPRHETHLAELLTSCEVARLLHYKVMWMMGEGIVPNVESAIDKTYAYELNQKAAEFGMQVLGPLGLLREGSPYAPLYGRIPSNYLCSIGSTIMQGSSEIDRDVIAQRGLGLPRLR